MLSGRVKVYASNAQGREFAIAFHGPGEYVGEMTLDGGVRSASVVTIDPTVCAVVHREQFREFILKNPDFALHLIDKLIKRVRATTEDVKSLALTDVYGRLVRLLNTLAGANEDGTRFASVAPMMTSKNPPVSTTSHSAADRSPYPPGECAPYPFEANPPAVLNPGAPIAMP